MGDEKRISNVASMQPSLDDVIVYVGYLPFMYHPSFFTECFSSNTFLQGRVVGPFPNHHLFTIWALD